MITWKIIKLFGVSKFNTSKDYYKILNLTTSASQAEIKNAYRQLAKKYHPDAYSGKQEMFKQLNQAYQVLSAEDTKRLYDQQRNFSNSNNRNKGYTRVNKQKSQNSNTYRGYERQQGWDSQQYRQTVMQQIFKEQQKSRMYHSQREGQKNKFTKEKFQKEAQKIRKYNPQIKIRQQEIRKAFEQEQNRRQKQFQDYRDKTNIDVGQVLGKKIEKMAQGFKQNIEGVKKIQNYLKSFWKKKK